MSRGKRVKRGRGRGEEREEDLMGEKGQVVESKKEHGERKRGRESERKREEERERGKEGERKCEEDGQAVTSCYVWIDRHV